MYHLALFFVVRHCERSEAIQAAAAEEFRIALQRSQ